VILGSSAPNYYLTSKILTSNVTGFGQLAGGIVGLILVSGFKGSLSTAASYATCTGVCRLAVDKMWRVLIGKPYRRKFLVV
jgi:hypothetical protein